MGKINAESLRQRISQYTNSQNEISIRDMHSDNFQQSSIQENINNHFDGFFWERKSGERQLKMRQPDSATWERKHKPNSLRIIDNLTAAKIAYGYHYEKPIEAVRLKEEDIFLLDKTFNDIFVDIPPKQFVISWILDQILKKSIQYIQNPKNQKTLASNVSGSQYEFDSVIDLLRSEYAKRTCLALVHSFLKKNIEFDNIEDAIIRFMGFSASKNCKPLNKAGGISEEQIVHIRPIFLCIMEYFDIVFRDIFFVGKNLSTSQPEIESKHIREKFEIQASAKDGGLYYSTYCEILAKMQSTNRTSDGKITKLIDNFGKKIISEANNLD